MATPAQRSWAETWLKHARRNLWFLLWACLNLSWAIYKRAVLPWWIIVVNVGCVVLITSNVFTALKWYFAYLDGEAKLKQMIEELFK